MATDSSAHALACQDDRFGVCAGEVRQSGTMACNQLRKGIRPCPPGEHVGVVKRRHGPNRREEPDEILHPCVRTRRASAGREQKNGSQVAHQISCGSAERRTRSPPRGRVPPAFTYTPSEGGPSCF